jgi:predicted MPP superfamily phosphohydrolase
LRFLVRPIGTPASSPALASIPADSAPAPRAFSLSRRAVIRAGTASLPAMAAMTGASGLATAWQRPRIPVIPMRFEGLHPDLEGLRILQLSDLHLGACAGLDDLKRSLDEVMAGQQPDLIVVTGDLADDPSLIPGALDLVTRARARYGAIASLGNHEYLHDIAVTRPKYEASAVPLLVSAGRTLSIGRARLFIGGSDDPVHMHGDIAGMLRPSIARAASHAPAAADFRLLLCHRPEGHGPAADHGFDLTLSGHTHGGQLGLFGRSLLEKLRPGTGWWGTYARTRRDGRRSRLYTTSGFGHWFPFRVGCPTEMPVLVLERAPGPRNTASTSRRPA